MFLGRIDWSDLVTQVVATLLAAGIIFLLTLCWNQRRKISGLEEKLRTCEDDYSKLRNRAEKAEGEAGDLRTTNALYEQELKGIATRKRAIRQFRARMWDCDPRQILKEQ